MNRFFPGGWNGRYGLDQLSIAMAALSCFLSLFLPRYHRNGFFTLVSLFCAALLRLALWRTLSRDTSRRWAENEKFLRYWNPIQQKIACGWNRLRDRAPRYFRCPGCTAPPSCFFSDNRTLYNTANPRYTHFI